MPRLLRHSLAYLLLLVAATWLMPPDSSFSGDAGAYGGQVHALRHDQGWTLDRPLPVVAQEHEGWLNTAITPDGPTPYTANPGYARLLTAVVGAVHGEPAAGERAGDVALGLHIVPVLSAVAAAALAWLVAARLHRPSAPLAFWLLALGPTLVNATTLWAHTLSTALGGLAVLAMLRVTDPAPAGPRPVSARTSAAVLVLTAALSAGAVVRTEALFWLGAVTLVGLVRARSWTGRVALGAAGATSALVWLLNRRWGAGLRADRLPIETSIEALNQPPGWLAGRLPAAWMLLVNSPTGGVGPLLTILAVTCAGAAVYRIHRPRSSAIGPAVLLWLAVAAYAVRLGLEPGATISGLLGAWPALAVALGAGAGSLLALARSAAPGAASARSAAPGADPSAPRPPAAPALPALPAVLAPAALLTGCVVATQYASSGGLQWGGRYLSFAFVPLAAGAAVVGRSVVEHYRRSFVGLLVLPAVIGLAAAYHLNQNHLEAVDQASLGQPDVVITESVALPRIAWRELPTAYYRATEDDVDALVDQLAAAGVPVVNVHGLGGNDLADVGAYRVIDLVGPVRRLELRTPPQGPRAN